jgi:hypothetical protein
VARVHLQQQLGDLLALLLIHGRRPPAVRSLSDKLYAV